MRLLAVTPIVVDPDELDRRRRRYAALSPDGVEVVLENLGEDPALPRALDTDADVRASEEAVVAFYQATDPAGWDGYLPDCVLDPGIDRDLGRPAYGIGRLAAAFLSGLGGGFVAVARNEAIAGELDRRLGDAPDAATVVMDLSFDDIAHEARWSEAVAQHVGDLACAYVFNACSAVDVSSAGDGPRVVDPTRAALAILGLAEDVDAAGGRRG